MASTRPAQMFHDPSDEEDTGWDWSAYLGADLTISSSAWTAYKNDGDGVRSTTEEITLSNDGITGGTSTYVRVSGGTLPTDWEDLHREPDYYATNRITLSNGEVKERSIPIWMVQA